jgi:hypothetical protein
MLCSKLRRFFVILFSLCATKLRFELPRSNATGFPRTAIK